MKWALDARRKRKRYEQEALARISERRAKRDGAPDILDDTFERAIRNQRASGPQP
jgi:hypothetical protein